MPRDLVLGWYAVRRFRRPWTWRPTLTTRTVVIAVTWGRWGVQVMRTANHPRNRAAFAEHYARIRERARLN